MAAAFKITEAAKNTVYCSLFALSVATFPIHAQAQSPQTQDPYALNCADFRHEANGKWTPLVRVRVFSPRMPNSSLELGRGTSFYPGVYMNGVDLGALLNQQCR
jgi:hypothetical protein